MEFVTNINKQLNEIFKQSPQELNKILITIAKEHGGKAYLVGGAVRDEIMGIESKDFDYLITKTPIQDISQQLSKYLVGAKIDEVGKSFGIIKDNMGGEEYDIAIPRNDENRQNVQTDPNISVEQDLLRRDLVINALAKDLETGEVISPPGYDGISDIKNKIIRSVGNPIDRFKEDPLRILRCLQFATRFNFDIENNTLDAIKRNRDLLKNVSGERFWDEFYKGWTKGSKDRNKFFNLLNDTGIGILMFGTDFDPIPLKNDENDTTYDSFIKQYIAAFLKGGDYTKLSKKVDEHNYIKIARILYKIFNNNDKFDDNDIKQMSNFGKLFPLITSTFYDISETLGKWLHNRLSKPLIPKKESGKYTTWELPFTGGDLVEISSEIGKELKGKSISDTVIKLIYAYNNGDIPLPSDDIVKTKEEIKNWMTTILKETYIKDNNRIDILRSRINNILYECSHP